MQLNSGRRWRVAGVTTLLTALIIGSTAPAALATIGMPDDYTVDYISGGAGGVSTDKFYTNANEKACVTASFKVKKKKDDGNNPGLKYYVELWRNDALGDTLMKRLTYTSGTSSYASYGKYCVTGLGSNQDYHWSFKKVEFDTGTLTGYGTISLS